MRRGDRCRHSWLLHLLVQIRSRAGANIQQSIFFFDDLVVIARGQTPDPIPNSAVKTLSADGTPS